MVQRAERLLCGPGRAVASPHAVRLVVESTMIAFFSSLRAEEAPFVQSQGCHARRKHVAGLHRGSESRVRRDESYPTKQLLVRDGWTSERRNSQNALLFEAARWVKAWPMVGYTGRRGVRGWSPAAWPASWTMGSELQRRTSTALFCSFFPRDSVAAQPGSGLLAGTRS